MQRILIMGATSAIAEAAARQFAARGDALFLVARNLPTLQAVAADLTTFVPGRRLDDGQRESHRGRGVHGIPAFLQNVDSGLVRQLFIADDHGLRPAHRRRRPLRLLRVLVPEIKSRGKQSKDGNAHNHNEGGKQLSKSHGRPQSMRRILSGQAASASANSRASNPLLGIPTGSASRSLQFQ